MAGHGGGGLDAEQERILESVRAMLEERDALIAEAREARHEAKGFEERLAEANDKANEWIAEHEEEARVFAARVAALLSIVGTDDSPHVRDLYAEAMRRCDGPGVEFCRAQNALQNSPGGW